MHRSWNRENGQSITWKTSTGCASLSTNTSSWIHRRKWWVCTASKVSFNCLLIFYESSVSLRQPNIRTIARSNPAEPLRVLWQSEQTHTALLDLTSLGLVKQIENIPFHVNNKNVSPICHGFISLINYASLFVSVYHSLQYVGFPLSGGERACVLPYNMILSQFFQHRQTTSSSWVKCSNRYFMLFSFLVVIHR